MQPSDQKDFDTPALNDVAKVMGKLWNRPYMSRRKDCRIEKKPANIHPVLSPQTQIYMLSLGRAVVVALHRAKIVSGMLIPALRKT